MSNIQQQKRERERETAMTVYMLRLGARQIDERRRLAASRCADDVDDRDMIAHRPKPRMRT